MEIISEFSKILFCLLSINTDEQTYRFLFFIWINLTAIFKVIDESPNDKKKSSEQNALLNIPVFRASSKMDEVVTNIQSYIFSLNVPDGIDYFDDTVTLVWKTKF